MRDVLTWEPYGCSKAAMGAITALVTPGVAAVAMLPGKLCSTLWVPTHPTQQRSRQSTAHRAPAALLDRHRVGAAHSDSNPPPGSNFSVRAFSVTMRCT